MLFSQRLANINQKSRDSVSRPENVLCTVLSVQTNDHPPYRVQERGPEEARKRKKGRRRRRRKRENVAHTCAWKPTFRPICADKTERRATQWARRQTGHGYHCRGRVPPRQTGNFHLPQLSFPSLSTSKRSSSSNVARPPPGTILFCSLRDCSPATTVCLAGHSKLLKIFAISAAFHLSFARNAWYF